MTDRQRQAIRETLSEFNFSGVQAYMRSRGWKWADERGRHLPSIVELYQKAENALTEAMKRRCTVMAGGFIAHADKSGLEIHFSIASAIYEAEEEELDDLYEE